MERRGRRGGMEGMKEREGGNGRTSEEGMGKRSWICSTWNNAIIFLSLQPYPENPAEYTPPSQEQ